MALKTLKDVNLSEYITIDDEKNAITFKIQNGPIKEKGENGCQIDDLIYVAKEIIYGLNEQFPCNENRNAVGCLKGALLCLEQRTNRRKAEGIEGTSNEMEAQPAE